MILRPPKKVPKMKMKMKRWRIMHNFQIGSMYVCPVVCGKSQYGACSDAYHFNFSYLRLWNLNITTTYLVILSFPRCTCRCVYSLPVYLNISSSALIVRPLLTLNPQVGSLSGFCSEDSRAALRLYNLSIAHTLLRNGCAWFAGPNVRSKPKSQVSWIRGIS
jgi:hypothetical protein